MDMGRECQLVDPVNLEVGMVSNIPEYNSKLSFNRGIISTIRRTLGHRHHSSNHAYLRVRWLLWTSYLGTNHQHLFLVNILRHRFR
jgi:hypothetical protein